MAEARSAVHKPIVDQLDEGNNTIQSIYHAWWRSIRRNFFRTRNSIKNGLWPTHIYNLGITTGAVTILLWRNWEWSEPLTRSCWWLADKFNIPIHMPIWIRLPLVAFAFGMSSFIVLLYVRRFALRALLSYNRWMFEPPKSQSWRTLIWGFTVRLFSGYSPSLYSYQASLPKMPVPALKSTLIGLIESLKPVYGEDSKEIEELVKQSKSFERGIGQRLQKWLTLKSWWAPNYVTDWWEKYVYLMGRDSIINNSNYYIMDHSYWKPTSIPAARAAIAVYQMMLTRQNIIHEQLTPLVIRNTIPLCMSQYERIFSTTRIPGEEIDKLKHFSDVESRHIVVQSNGHWYRFSLYNKNGDLFPPSVLERQLQWIIDDSAIHEIGQSEAHLAALTAWDRKNWAQVRQQHFVDSVNKYLLDSIEMASFVVSFIPDAPESSNFSSRATALLNGNGANIWADKSFNMIFFANGHLGVNSEHSWADAPVLAHAMEILYTNEVLSATDNGRVTNHPTMYDSLGHAVDYNGNGPSSNETVKFPERLVWECHEDLGRKIDEAYLQVLKNNADMDLVVRDYNSYGKGVIKCFKVSPDAYIQLAIHLAYYRLNKRFVLTYESSMTRLFNCGRTETVRSLTQESVDFVLAMVAGEVDRGLKIRLMRRACDRHQQLYKRAMSGKGIDRHLFALYVLARGLGQESEFLRNALTLPWTLSTSQQPQQQVAESPSCDLPEFRDKVCPGGGFGPVSDHGYGVSYMVAGDFRIFFHVCSKKSAPNTSSQLFMDQIFQSLNEMKGLFDGAGA